MFPLDFLASESRRKAAASQESGMEGQAVFLGFGRVNSGFRLEGLGFRV